MHLRTLLIVIVISLLAVPGWTFATAPTVTYNNFGPGDTYSNGGVWLGSNAPFGGWELAGVSFVPSVSGGLVELDAAMWLIGSVPNEIKMVIRDDAGNFPGAPIWSHSYTGNLRSSFSSAMATFAVPDGPMLQSGTRYWLAPEVQLTIGSRPYNWQSGLTGSTFDGILFSGQPWQIYSGVTGYSLRVWVDVPEPGTPPIIAVAALVAFSARRGTSRAGPQNRDRLLIKSAPAFLPVI